MREMTTKLPQVHKAKFFVATAGLIVGGLAVVLGCGSGSGGAAPAPVSREATKKSMEATGNYYKQRFAAGKRSASKRSQGKASHGRPGL